MYFALALRGAHVRHHARPRGPRSRSSSSRAPAASLRERRSPCSGGIGRAARPGAIIKGGRYLEALWAVDTVVLDKTGTADRRKPTVTRFARLAGLSESIVLESAAIAEARSEHPLARAILRRAGEQGIAIVHPDTFDYAPGRGIVARINGEEIVA